MKRSRITDKRKRVGKPFYIHARVGLCHCSLEATTNPLVIGPQGWWIFDGCNNKLLASGRQRAVDFLREFCPRLKPGEQLRVRIVVDDVAERNAAILSSRKPKRVDADDRAEKAESEAATLRERVKELEATYLHTPVGHVIEKLQEEVKKLTAQLNGIKDLKTYLAALKERLKP